MSQMRMTVLRTHRHLAAGLSTGHHAWAALDHRTTRILFVQVSNPMRRLFIALLLSFAVAAPPAELPAQRSGSTTCGFTTQPPLPWPPVATFSILGYDPATGEVGGAVQSRVFSVGNGVLWAEAGVGAVATQAIVDVSATGRRRSRCCRRA